MVVLQVETYKCKVRQRELTKVNLTKRSRTDFAANAVFVANSQIHSGVCTLQLFNNPYKSGISKSTMRMKNKRENGNSQQQNELVNRK
jgi:hypothetical protein